MTKHNIPQLSEWRWASEKGFHGMPYPEELEYLGYVKVKRHIWYPESWLMMKEIKA